VANLDPAETLNESIQEPSPKDQKPTSDALHSGQLSDTQVKEVVPENYGKLLGLLGVVAAAGLIGYMIGKNSNSSDSQLPTPRA
jgi:hypothetical protein